MPITIIDPVFSKNGIEKILAGIAGKLSLPRSDLPSTVSSQVRLFADDCLLYRPIKCRADQEQLQRDLSALQDWADRWGVCFNPSKCSVLRVSRPK